MAQKKREQSQWTPPLLVALTKSVADRAALCRSQAGRFLKLPSVYFLGFGSSCFANSNTPTWVLVIFSSVVIVLSPSMKARTLPDCQIKF